jgi:hypothetical protein
VINLRKLLVGLLAIAVTPSVAFAQGKATIARETAEYVLRRFAPEAEKVGAEALTRKIESLAIKGGDDAILATRKIGPRIFRIVEEAGEHGVDSVKLMAKFGDDAVWVVAKPSRMAIFLKYGDSAAQSMIRHGEISEPLLEAFGKPAAGALSAVSARSGRRLAMMSADGELAKIGRTPELLDVVAQKGDRAMDWIWRNKGALTVAAALTAFIANPEPFLDGTSDMAKFATEHVAQPIVSIPGQVATEAARKLNWNALAFCSVLAVSSLVGARMWLRHRPRLEKAKGPG